MQMPIVVTTPSMKLAHQLMYPYISEPPKSMSNEFSLIGTDEEMDGQKKIQNFL